MVTAQIEIKLVMLNDDRKEGGKGDIESLARNMDRYGQINSITVVRHFEGDYRYRIIAGRRRICAAESLGWKEIRADIYDKAELKEGDEQMIALSENAAREEMNAIDEGVLYAAELKKGVPVEELAALFCRNKSTVYQRAKLASLIPELKDYYRQKRMSLVVAGMAAVLPEETQRKIVEINEGRSVGSYKSNVQEWDIKDLVRSISKDNLNYLGNCGACDKCEKRTHYSDRTLFPELKDKGDTCFDHDCYTEKLAIRVSQEYKSFCAENEGTKEYIEWGGDRILRDEDSPSVIIDGTEILPLDQDEIELEEEMLTNEKLEGKIKVYPFWDGNSFSFVHVAKEEDYDNAFYSDPTTSRSEWEQKRVNEMKAVIKNLPQDKQDEVINDKSNWYPLLNRINRRYKDLIKESVGQGFLAEKLAINIMMKYTIDSIRDVFPDAGLTDEDSARPNTEAVFQKLSALGMGVLIKGTLCLTMSCFAFMPEVQNVEESEWPDIFRHLEIDIIALKDKAVQECTENPKEE